MRPSSKVGRAMAGPTGPIPQDLAKTIRFQENFVFLDKKFNVIYESCKCKIDTNVTNDQY